MQLIYQKKKNIYIYIWEYFEELHTEKLENLNEMDNCMEKGGLPDWIMKKTENLGYL